MPLLNIVHRLITVRLNKFIAQIILTKLTIVMSIALQLKQYLRIKSKHTFDQLVGSKRIKKTTIHIHPKYVSKSSLQP